MNHHSFPFYFTATIEEMEKDAIQFLSTRCFDPSSCPNLVTRVTVSFFFKFCVYIFYNFVNCDYSKL
jgi:hypothetical protein